MESDRSDYETLSTAMVAKWHQGQSLAQYDAIIYEIQWESATF